jgi:hypothetical protein
MFNRGLFNAGYLAEGLAAEKSTPVATLLRGIGYRKNRIIKVQIKPLIRKLKINTKIFLTRLST